VTLDLEETLRAVATMFDHPHQWYGGRTYAQHGDDLALINLFHCLRIPQPSYLDIGAHHPFVLSNTSLLYQRGSRGINVEANPALIEDFKKFRPEDITVNVAVVGARRGSMMLNRFGGDETSGLNSLLPLKGHSLHDRVSVPTMTADEIVSEHANGVWPDLLSIDAEGMDIPILKSINYSRGGPKVICAEAVSQMGDVCDKLRALLGGHDYGVHSFCGSNMLFVRNDLMGFCR
jgi:FkbM family methyltransferase